MRYVPALFSVGLLFLTQGCAAPAGLWSFELLDKIGGVTAHVEGAPQQIDTAAGKAVQFDGAKDALFVDTHPLAGAKTWTIEAIIRPDGGAFEQRWLHLAEVDPKTGQDSATRFLFEIRVKENRWYLDAFTTGEGYKITLIDPSKTFALGRWYRVAMTYDGKTFKSYVDGVEQAESPLTFKPQGAGHSSIGVRMNRVNYYHGAILNIRFTPRALSPDAFEAMPQGLN